MLLTRQTLVNDLDDYVPKMQDAHNCLYAANSLCEIMCRGALKQASLLTPKDHYALHAAIHAMRYRSHCSRDNELYMERELRSEATRVCKYVPFRTYVMDIEHAETATFCTPQYTFK
jgi:hypothetical protein